MGYIYNSYRFASSGLLLPVGLILPYNGTLSSAPSGTSIWNYASGDRLIRAYSAADGTGGSATLSTYTSGAGGTHTGSNAYMWACYDSGAGYNRYYKTQPNHSHTVTATYRPPRRQQPFVKITTEMETLPQYCGFFSDTTISATGISAFGTNGYYLGAPNSRTAASNQAAAATASLNSVGNHTHEESYVRLDSNNGQLVKNPQTTRGAAAHSNAGTFTESLKNYTIGLWYATTAGLVLPPGAFAFYDQPGTPDGWLVCDGTSGTPDLTNTFLKINTASLGVQSGNDTISISGYSTYAGSHNHSGTNGYDSAIARHTSNSGNHRHTITKSGASLTYPYYRLRVLKADL